MEDLGPDGQDAAFDYALASDYDGREGDDDYDYEADHRPDAENVPF
jgi:hypothetical protein